MNSLFIYRLLQWFGFPFIVIYFLLRGLRDRRYFRGFRERLGSLPRNWRQPAPGAVWLHAVSVGEVLSAAALLRSIRAALPETAVFVSTTTLAGRGAAEDKLRGYADGIFYAPIDFAVTVRRVFRLLRPRALIVLETEIWPNLWREARRFGCALIVVNGRISDRAFPRYLRLRWFFRRVLSLPELILAQSRVSRERYQQLGAPDARYGGNLKYDFQPSGDPPEAIRHLLARLKPARVWIAASTVAAEAPGDPDEDEAVLAAFREVARTVPGLLLVLAPRKPERFDGAANLLRREGIPFLRRSQLAGNENLELPGVLVLDTIGELGSVFGLADVVFMGGTLASRGGHNILEPALFGKPVVAGPHLENFAEIAEAFNKGGGLARIGSAGELGRAVALLLGNDGLREQIGGRARALAEAERGAATRAAAEISARYWAAAPRYVRPLPTRALLALLSWLWRLGTVLHRSLCRKRRLATPVVSVGGIAAGGAGKTPVVLWLAERIPSAAILTRGYGRESTEPVMLAPGEHAPASRTGDEPQIYLRAGVAPVAIHADRFRSGRMLEQRFKPRILLLDDGFQHWRLHRDFDLVILDGLDPFAGAAVLPLGRLREPVSALRRADAVVVTRIPGSAGIEAPLRRSGYHGPVFTARFVLQGWFNAATGEPADVPPRTAAFCALGNPASFWSTLRQIGISPAFRRAFPDHHKYTAAEIDSMAGGEDALLTTEKDVANLPESFPGRVLWLKVGLEVDRGQELISLIERAITAPSRSRLGSASRRPTEPRP